MVNPENIDVRRSQPTEEIEGVIVTKLNLVKDYRGSLIETYRNDDPICYPSSKSSRFFCPVMSYMSWTFPGVVRGPHEHVYQTDMFIFAGPGVFDLYLWDNRRGSETYAKHIIFEYLGMDMLRLDRVNPVSVIIPPGVVHGYKNVGVYPALCVNMPNALYKGTHRKGFVDEIRHEDTPDNKFKIPQ